MSKILNKKEIEKFSRQIILKDIGSLGQKKIKQAKVLVVGAGGLGCSVAEFLVRAGIGNVGIVDNDIVNISNIHRRSLYDTNDIKNSKVKSAKKKLKRINPNTIIKLYNLKIHKVLAFIHDPILLFNFLTNCAYFLCTFNRCSRICIINTNLLV